MPMPSFMRIKRDEALAAGDPDSGIRIFAAQHPELFIAAPEITAGNIGQATDLALLLKMAGRSTKRNACLRPCWPPTISRGLLE